MPLENADLHSIGESTLASDRDDAHHGQSTSSHYHRLISDYHHRVDERLVDRRLSWDSNYDSAMLDLDLREPDMQLPSHRGSTYLDSDSIGKRSDSLRSDSSSIGRKILKMARKLVYPKRFPPVHGPPIFPKATAWILSLAPARYLKAHQLSYIMCWTAVMILFIWANEYAASTDLGPPRYISCNHNAWKPNDQCGLNGTYCKPFAQKSFVFRCEGGCHQSKLSMQNWVGDNSLPAGKSMVVGSVCLTNLPSFP